MTLHASLAGNGDDEAGEPCPAPEVDPLAPAGRRMFHELQAVGDVTRPHMRERRCAHEIVGGLPFGEEPNEALEIVPDRIRDEAESIKRASGFFAVMLRRGQRKWACV